MAVQEVKVSINTTDTKAWMDGLKTRAETGIEQLAQSAAGKMEAYAKTNAPWTDRTGAARRQLTGSAGWSSRTLLVIKMSHMVDYGVYLELAHQKKYAILEESVNAYKDEFLKSVGKLIGQLS